MNNHNETQDKLAELRKQAEKLLAERDLPAMSVNSLEDAQRLITELQVHQIELEMQNDELSQTHEQLNVEREKYADLYNFAPVAYFIFDHRDIILDLNLAAAELLGNERKYLVERPITPYLTPESLQVFVEHRQQALETRLSQTCELTIRRRDGALAFVQVQTVALYTDPKGTQLWRSVMTDMTERKRAENIMQARLRITKFAAEHSLDELLQNALDELCALSDSPIGFFHFVEPDQKTLSLQAWSTRTLQEFCTASGKGQHYDIDQAGVWVDCVREGHPVIHNDYANLPHLKGLPEGHAPVIREMVFPITRHHKIVAIIGVGNKALKYTEDDVVYASRLADLIWDITERKRAESQREAALEKLRESEERFRSLAVSMNDVVYTLDTEQRHIGVYGEWVERAGLPPEYFLGKTARDLFGAKAARVHEEANACALRGEIAVYEWSAPSAAGAMHYQTSVSPLRNTQKEIIGVVGVGRDITEIKRTEERLRESEEKYRRLVENAPDIVYTFSNQRGGIYYSPHVEQVLGYSPEYLYEHPMLWNESIHPDDRPRITETLRNFEVGKSFDIEYRIQNAQGQWLWLRDRSIGRDVGNGEMLIEGLATDVTERRRAEEELKAAKEELERFFRLVPDLVCIASTDGYFKRLNDAWEAALGFTIAELLAEPFENFIHPDDVEPTRQEIAKRVGGGSTINFINRYRTKSGSYRWLEWNAIPAIDGLILYAAARDITHRKQAEEQLLDYQHRLEAQNVELRKLSTAIEQSGNTIVITDTKGDIQYANPRFAETTGYTIEEALGKNPRILKSGAQSEEYYKNLWDTITNGKVWHGELHNKRKDGALYWEAATIAPVLDDSGQVINYIAIKENVTARKQAEDEVRLLNATLEQRIAERTQELLDAQEKLMRNEKLAVLGQMAGSVGHEIRNPLAVISNSIYFLKMVQTDATDKVKEYLDRIEKNIHIANKIIADLLEFTRIKSVDRAPVSIPDLIRQTLERFPAPENIQVEIDLPGDLPKAYADPQHVIQVLGNLTLNACQAMKDGGKLTVTARAQAEMIQIAVQDTGAGISPENMKKLFEPLFTTKTKGIGLGLAVCQKLIEANSGRIEVESDGVPGRGSIFTLYLPFYEALK